MGFQGDNTPALSWYEQFNRSRNLGFSGVSPVGSKITMGLLLLGRSDGTASGDVSLSCDWWIWSQKT